MLTRVFVRLDSGWTSTILNSPANMVSINLFGAKKAQVLVRVLAWFVAGSIMWAHDVCGKRSILPGYRKR